MKAKEEILLSSIPLDSLANSVSEIILEHLKKSIPTQGEKPKPEYLTRKQSYNRIGISGPTFDRLVLKTNTTKFGKGKGARFLKEDVEKIYEQLNNHLYKR